MAAKMTHVISVITVGQAATLGEGLAAIDRGGVVNRMDFPRIETSFIGSRCVALSFYLARWR